jgi:hypothetical protein
MQVAAARNPTCLGIHYYVTPYPSPIWPAVRSPPLPSANHTVRSRYPGGTAAVDFAQEAFVEESKGYNQYC